MRRLLDPWGWCLALLLFPLVWLLTRRREMPDRECSAREWVFIAVAVLAWLWFASRAGCLW